jgi:hypothetical protein
MRHINFNVACLVALSTISTTAFAESPVLKPVEMTFDRNARENAADRYSNLCPIRIVSTVDSRQNKETIGTWPKGALLSGDMKKWVNDGLSDLASYGAPIESGNNETPPANGLLIKTSLTRAYTWHVGMKIYSMIALKAEFINGNGIVEEKYYRAHGDKTNMWSADSEYVTTLNYGMNNLLPVIAQDLVSLCKGTPVEKYSYASPAGLPKN